MLYAILDETDPQFVQIIEQVSRGEEVIVMRGTTPVAKFVPVTTEEPKALRPGFGSGKYALIYMADDFDAPLEDFKEYM